MKLPSLQWAAAIAVATSLGTFTASAQEDTPAGGPPPPPPHGEHGSPGGRRGGPGGGGRMMGGGPGGGIEGLLGRAGERLGITPEQKTKLEGIVEESRPTNRSLNDAVRKEREELRKTTQAASVDEGAIRAQAVKLATAEGDLAVQQAKTFEKLRGVLTPEQLAKFKEGPGQWRGEGRGGRGGRGERPNKQGAPASETAPAAQAKEANED